MAGLQTAGVELVVKNFSGFIAAMGRVNSTVQKFGADSAKMAQQVQTAGDRVTRATNAQANAMGNLEKAKIRQAQAQRAYDNQLAKNVAVINAGNKVTAKAAEQVIRYGENVDIAAINVQQMTRHVDDANLSLATQTSKFEELSQAMQLGQQIGSGAGGISGITGAIGVAGSTLTGIGIAIAAVTAGFAVLAAGAIAAFNGIKNLTVAIATGLINAFKVLWGVMQPVISGFFKIISLPITRTFKFLSSTLKEVSSDFGNTLAEFQRFGIMFEGLMARDIAGKFGMSMADAFKLAVGPANELFDWIKKLAVTTPFTAKGITEVLAMANAMGLTTGQAKDLTVAVGNFTAGMGLQEEHMWRIIYNFGQMLAQGKVTGREFRDLAISFVPVWKMLDNMAAKAGMATEEFKKLALAGKVPVPAFFEEFIRMANNDFPNAMERMAKTWEGVKGNAKDFIQVVIGMNALGPVFNEITTAMANSLQDLIRYLTPVSILIGQNLKMALDIVKEGFITATDAMDRFKASIPSSAGTSGFASAIAKIAIVIKEVENAIGGFIDWLNKNLAIPIANLAKNSEMWGYNIIAGFANGMAKGISLITQVIGYIAKVISYWLSPGSPPKALPDLPEWGMGAMAEYLRGFTEADFDALEGIQKPLEQALDILVDTGRIGERAAANLYRDLSMAIAEAISSGNIEEGLFERIAQAAGPFGQEIAKLARLQIQLAQATNALVAAEKALEEAQKRESAARVSVNKKVKEYNAMLRAGADKTSLAAKLAEVQVSEQAARASTEERIRQEQLVEAAKAQVEALKEAVSLQERLVQQLLEITRKQIIPIEADTSGAAGALSDLESMLDMFATKPFVIPDATLRAFVAADEAATKAWEAREAFRKATEEAQKWFDNMAKAFDPVTKNIGELEKALSGLTGLGQPSKDSIMFGNAPKTNLDKMIEDFKKLGASIKFVFDEIILLLRVLGLFTADTKPTTIVEGLTNSLGVLALVIGIIVRSFTQAILWVGLFLAVIKMAEVRLLEFGADAKATWEEFVFTARAKWDEFKDSVINKWDEFKKDIAGRWTQFKADAAATWEELKTTAAAEWTRIGNEIHARVLAWIIQLNADWGNIKYWATYHWNKIKDAIKEKIEKARDLVRDAMAAIQRFIDGIRSSALITAIEGIITVLKNLIAKAKAALRLIGINVPGETSTDVPIPEKFGGSVKRLSPAVVGEHGWEVFVPYAKGMILNQRQISDIIQVAASQVYGGTMPYLRNMVASPMQPSTVVAQSKQVNINFGGVVVANGMDMAAFEANVRNIVRQEFA